MKFHKPSQCDIEKDNEIRYLCGDFQVNTPQSEKVCGDEPQAPEPDWSDWPEVGGLSTDPAPKKRRLKSRVSSSLYGQIKHKGKCFM